MSFFVSNGALLKCSFGVAPTPLRVLPNNRIMGPLGPMATIMDSKPFVNIMPFGLCTSLSNPMVLAATIAQLGVLSPQPCIPMTIAPWLPGSPTVQTQTLCALNNTSKCLCLWKGVIQPIMPGQFTVQVP